MADGRRDLQGIATWEPRSIVDRVIVALYRGGLAAGRAVVVALALAILLGQVFLAGLGGTLAQPVVGVFVALSVVPTLALAWYVHHLDVTTPEPLGLLVATVVLGGLFAGFAGVVNSVVEGLFVAPLPDLLAPIAMGLMFVLVVGPVEEGVKLLAIRVFAYRSDRFDAVVDGAVYGAAAGLGFATIENAIYIAGETGVDSPLALIGSGGSIAFVRALAGPGHVIYAAFAGYYLGLAKFNPDRAGPIVLKGLLIAALIHAGYNVLVSIVPTLYSLVSGTPPLLAYAGFVLVYDGIFVALLYRKLQAYRRAYDEAAGSAVESSAA
ncbi:PrsW family intramembrane metalloprotease [Halococcoides cellulosivorans]|uniref:PrsW family intramembrane metalloprotease n=2 Tax=Halococcoides cellulosivorans TaxID=1679096 RepID=A0A2R4X4F2_9EURY|nr:PrsW family intramembrane metalloprotease [Halococcoides cellulosivorans]